MVSKETNYVKNTGNFKSFEESINDELNLRLNEIPTLESIIFIIYKKFTINKLKIY